MATFRTSQPVSAADPSLPHLILVGLSGAGKSTVGKLVAAELKRSFLDFDTEITRRQGMSIPEIFGQRGEAYFRQLEHELTTELQELGNMILAPGSGWVTQPDTVALLHPPATLVYLKVSPEVAILRMGATDTGRPLLNRPDPRAELARLLVARRAIFESAEVVINVDHVDPQRVMRRIIEQL
jgi:shikimate kinase